VVVIDRLFVPGWISQRSGSLKPDRQHLLVTNTDIFKDAKNG
jgi:hypothetical protein